MTDAEETTLGVIFQIHHSTSAFAIPIRHVAWIEHVKGKVISFPHDPNHGVYSVHGKNICAICLSQLLGFEKSTSCTFPTQNLIILANQQTGFLVEAVLGVETLHPYKNASPLTPQLVFGMYCREGSDDIILGLNVPKVLSLAASPAKI